MCWSRARREPGVVSQTRDGAGLAHVASLGLCRRQGMSRHRASKKMSENRPNINNVPFIITKAHSSHSSNQQGHKLKQKQQHHHLMKCWNHLIAISSIFADGRALVPGTRSISVPRVGVPL